MSTTQIDMLTMLRALSGSPAAAAALFLVAVVCLMVSAAWLCRSIAARESHYAPSFEQARERVRRSALVRQLAKHIPPRAAALVRKYLSGMADLGLRLGVGLVISAGALALFTIISDHVLDGEALVQFDLRLSAMFSATVSHSGLTTFHAISYAGSVATIAAVALLVAGVLTIRGERLLAAAWVTSLAGGALLNVILKHLFHRPRPAGASAFLVQMSFSFPSGHAMGSFIAYGLLAYLLLIHTRDVRCQAGIVATAASLIALIGLSRLYLGVHYFTDVIGGFAAGAVWLSVCIVTIHVIRLRAAAQGVRPAVTENDRSMVTHQTLPRRRRGWSGGRSGHWLIGLCACLVTLPANAYAQNDTTRADTAALTKRSASDGLLDSLVPARLRAAIRQANPELRARRAQLDAVTARAGAAGRLPASTLAAEIEEVPSGFNVPQAGSIKANVERELFAGSRLGAARGVAAADVRIAAITLVATEQRLVATAAQALTSASGGFAIASRLAGEDSLLTSAEGSVRTRFSVGEAKYVDVLRLRTERLRVASDRLTALTQARLGRRTLIALLSPGLYPTPPVADTAAGALPNADLFVDSLLAAHALLISRLVLPPAPGTEALLVSTGRLAFAEAAYARAERARALALAELRPRVSAILGAQRYVGDNGGFTYGPTIGATVTLPFTARAATTSARAAAERELISAAADRRASVAAARADLLAAAERYEAARSRVNAYDTALLRGAREEREAALASYRTSGITLLELLDFERALARAEIDRIRGVIDAAAALADLLGGGALNPAPPSGRAGTSPVSTGPSQ